MTGTTALILYVLWTILLALSYATYRLPLVLTGSKKASHWERGNAVDDPAILVRAKGAHLNSLENLPLFAALVLVAVATGQESVVNGVAAIIIGARVLQGIVHMIGTSFILVFIRATCFLVQMALMIYIGVSLLGGV